MNVYNKINLKKAKWPSVNNIILAISLQFSIDRYPLVSSPILLISLLHHSQLTKYIAPL